MSHTFIIAEAGVNHNGLLDTAKRLVDAAATSGADAVKFQTFRTEKLVTATAAKAGRNRKPRRKAMAQPVQAPVMGRGMATNRVRAINPKFSCF